MNQPLRPFLFVCIFKNSSEFLLFFYLFKLTCFYMGLKGEMDDFPKYLVP